MQFSLSQLRYSATTPPTLIVEGNASPNEGGVKIGRFRPVADDE